MHTCVYVVMPVGTVTEVDVALEPFSELLEVEPHKQYLEMDYIRWIAEREGLLPGQLAPGVGTPAEYGSGREPALAAEGIVQTGDHSVKGTSQATEFIVGQVQVQPLAQIVCADRLGGAGDLVHGVESAI